MKRKALSLLLVLMLLLTMLPTPALAAEATATITVTNQTRRYIVINDVPYYSGSNGTLQNMDGTTATFAPGTYTLYYGPGGLDWSMDKTVYSGTATIAQGDTNVRVRMSSQRFSRFGNGSGSPNSAQLQIAKSIYYNTGNFDHIHIRVEGSYVIHVGSRAYTATVSNPTMVVRVNGNQVISKSWTGTTSYEWTYVCNIARSNLIEVELTLDLTYTDANGQRVVMEDVTVTYDNVNHLYKFVEAIAICDAIQGLDFTVSVEDIEEVITYHTVTYQWKVYGPNGEMVDLPAGSPLAPAATSGHQSESQYVYDTEYVTGTSFYDYENGLLYTFHGWDTYSHSPEFNVNPQAKGMSPLDDGDQDAANNLTVPITNDTYINGFWTVTELPPAPAYIVIDKVFAGDANAQAAASDLWFRIDTGYDADGDGGGTVDVDYTQILAARQTATGEYRLPIYQYDTPITITEYNADVPGYSRTTTVAVTGSNATGTAGTDSATVTLTPEYEGENIHLGTITFTNSYTRLQGDPINLWPTLSLMKTASDTNIGQAGVEFTLYTDAACTQALTTLTSGEGGLVALDFGALPGIQAGTYYLKETKALAGYHADPHAFTLTLTAGTPTEELRDGKFVTITPHTLSVTLAEGCDAILSPTLNRLHILNHPVLGSLNLSKEATGLDDAAKADMTAVIILHGPITRGADGAITGLGNRQELSLNAANGWSLTVADLPLGEYLLHESLASLHGYTWNGVSYGSLPTTIYNGITSAVLTVSDDTAVDLTITNSYTQWTVGDFYIRKVDGEGNALAGATFQIFRNGESGLVALADEEFTISATTGADGYAHFTGFTVPEGQESVTYYLRETQAPAGYYLSEVLYKVELKAVTANGHTSYEPKISLADASGAWVEASNFNRNSNLLTVVNLPVLGKLTLVKTFAGGVIPEGLTKITLRLAGPDGMTRNLELNAANSWSVTLTDLPLGTYTVTERDAAVPGYSLTTGYAVGDTTSAANAVVTLAEAAPGFTLESTDISAAATVTNTYTRNEETYEIPATLTIRKVATDGTPLAGAVFTMERLDESGQAIYTMSFTSNAQGLVIFDLLSGFIRDGQSYSGTYRLSETKAPDGYVKTDATWTVTIDENDGQLRVELNESKNMFENFWDWIVGGVAGQETAAWTWADDVLTVPNVKIIDAITVRKVWVASEGVAHPESVEAILYQNGQPYETVTLNAANDWTYTWTGLTEAHTWTVDEKSVPEGYEKAVTRDGYNFTITNSKIFQIIDVSAEKVWYGSTAHPASVELVLYRDGVAFETVTLSAANGWKHTWAGLTDEFTWTVDEPSVPSGYTKAVRQSGNHFTVTNTHQDIPKTGDSTNLLLWGLMMAVGTLGAAWMLLLLLNPRKRKTR